MKTVDRPFLPGHSPADSLPLARFLPPLPTGMVTAWLQQNVAPGQWILDPFGSNPAMDLEIAQAGYQVLVSSNNPIGSFLLEMLACAPSRAELQSVLAEIASIRRGDERLETHLQSLYMTRCAACEAIIPAQSFLWKKDELAPFARIYHCQHCGDEGERPTTQDDLDRLSALGPDHLHRARALGRISIDKDLARARAEEALGSYLNRPLYFLFTLMNKIEGLNIGRERRRLMQALALSTCDDGCALWPWPNGRTRPRQLTTPPQFREKNLWLALEDAANQWSTQGKSVPLMNWPEVPPKSGGICLFKGRLKNLLPLPNSCAPRAVVTVLPRPNQAYWTLSALWSGWLWGPDAVTPLKSVLERRRYDWHWHANALQSTFAAMRKAVSTDVPVFAILPELVPGFLTAALVAAHVTGYQLEGLAIQPEQAVGQITWMAQSRPITPTEQKLEEICGDAVQAYLRKRNEPSQYILLHAACLESILEAGGIPVPASGAASDALSAIQSSIDRVFSNKRFLVRFESQAQNNESGLWWLAAPPANGELSLADRVEMEVVRYVDRHPGSSLEEIERALNENFPGLTTPSRELVEIILYSYGEPSSATPTVWSLREREKPAARQANLQNIRQLLRQLAERLGYTMEGENPILWKDSQGTRIYLLYLFASSIISRFVNVRQDMDPHHCILVLPGSRSSLLAFKLQRDPRLAASVAEGWRFLKFRHLRRLLDRLDLTGSQWEELIDLDPPLWEEVVQLKMFDAE
jgi:hypothetical protein